jgi:hypothetical protein
LERLRRQRGEYYRVKAEEGRMQCVSRRSCWSCSDDHVDSTGGYRCGHLG